jgi:hypothetical protein
MEKYDFYKRNALKGGATAATVEPTEPSKTSTQDNSIFIVPKETSEKKEINFKLLLNLENELVKNKIELTFSDIFLK